MKTLIDYWKGSVDMRAKWWTQHLVLHFAVSFSAEWPVARSVLTYAGSQRYAKLVSEVFFCKQRWENPAPRRHGTSDVHKRLNKDLQTDSKVQTLDCAPVRFDMKLNDLFRNAQNLTRLYLAWDASPNTHSSRIPETTFKIMKAIQWRNCSAKSAQCSSSAVGMHTSNVKDLGIYHELSVVNASFISTIWENV